MGCKHKVQASKQGLGVSKKLDASHILWNAGGGGARSWYKAMLSTDWMVRLVGNPDVTRSYILAKCVYHLMALTGNFHLHLVVVGPLI